MLTNAAQELYSGISMELAEQGIPVVFPDTDVVPLRVGWRERARQKHQAALVEENAQLVFLNESGEVEKLVDMAPTLPGKLRKVRIGVAKPKAGKPINVVVSFDPRFSFREAAFYWGRVVSEVAKDETSGYYLKVNGRTGTQTKEELAARAGKTFGGFYEVLGARRSGQRKLFLGDRLMIGRERIKIPKSGK